MIPKTLQTPAIALLLSLTISPCASAQEWVEPATGAAAELAVRIRRVARRLSLPAESAPVPWSVRRVNAHAAWSRTRGAVGVCVVGAGFAAPSAGSSDETGRGAAISGIIATIAPGVLIQSVDVREGGAGSGPVLANALAQGIVSCASRGVRLIHVMATDEDPDRRLESAVRFASSRGAVVIAPAGGGPGSRRCGVAYPARHEGAISVTGSDIADRLLPEGCGRGAPNRGYGFFDDDGLRVSFIAPGADVPTRSRDGRTLMVTGSDAAAAVVTGLAALYLERHPEATPDGVLGALAGAASLLEGLPASHQGRGMIDAARLLAP